MNTAVSPRRARNGARASSSRGSERATTGDPSTAVGVRRVLRLVAIGLAAGIFSALFGVGGGIVVVPLLIALLAYDARVATATSLAAIIFTATAGTLTHGSSATSSG